MTLRITLKDGEQVIVNGAVLRSVGRTNLCIESKAAILRGRDVMCTEEATTPARRLYVACIGAYTDVDSGAAEQEVIVANLAVVLAGAASPVAKAACASFARRVASSDYYRALADCRTLMQLEAAELARR